MIEQSSNKPVAGRFSRKIIGIGTVFLIVIAGFSGYYVGSKYGQFGGQPTSGSAYQEQIANLTSRNHILDDKIASLRAQIQALEKQNSTSFVTITSLRSQLSSLQDQNTALLIEVDQLTRENSDQQNQIQNLKKTIETQSQNIGSLQAKLDCLTTKLDVQCAKSIGPTLIVWQVPQGVDISSQGYVSQVVPIGFDYHDIWTSTGIIRAIYMTLLQFNQYYNCDLHVHQTRISCVYKPDDATTIGPVDHANDTFTSGCNIIVVYENNNSNSIKFYPNVTLTYNGHPLTQSDWSGTGSGGFYTWCPGPV